MSGGGRLLPRGAGAEAVPLPVVPEHAVSLLSLKISLSSFEFLFPIV